MNNIYILSSGHNISRAGNVLKIVGKKNNKRIPVGSFDNVFIGIGNEITSSCIRFLSLKKKCIFFVNRSFKLNSFIVSNPLISSVNIRQKQYLQYCSNKIKLEKTKKLLQKKSKTLIEAINTMNLFYNKKNTEESFENFDEKIKQITNMEKARSFDGYMMKILFKNFRSHLNREFSFDKREYHPPKDPVNIVLSIVFTMFYSLLIPTVISKGFDPYASFFHVKRGDHAAFCSDLMEIARPSLIVFVLWLFNENILITDDFFEKSGKSYIKYPAILKIAREFSTKLLYPEKNPLNLCKKYLTTELSK
ncbi:MAG: CRISPR-associated endonuclease Cas1 [Candidatus Muiribacteriota bacterium]